MGWFECCFSNSCLYFPVKYCQVITIQTFFIAGDVEVNTERQRTYPKNWQLLLPYNGKTFFMVNVPIYLVCLVTKTKIWLKRANIEPEFSCSDPSHTTDYRDAQFYSLKSKEIWKPTICVVTCLLIDRQNAFSVMYSLCNLVRFLMFLPVWDTTKIWTYDLFMFCLQWRVHYALLFTKQSYQVALL